jgi:hypothetical protein
VNDALLLTMNNRTVLFPLITTLRPLASSVTLFVIAMVLLNVIVPLQQRRTIPPRVIAARNPASVQSLTTFEPRHPPTISSRAFELIAVP